MNCEICNKEYENDELRVYSSSMGPVSFRYCQNCIEYHAEPLAVIHAVVDGMNNINCLASWAHSITFFDNNEYHSIDEVFTNPKYKSKPIEYPEVDFDMVNPFLDQDTIEDIAQRLNDQNIMIQTHLTKLGWVGKAKQADKCFWSYVFPHEPGSTELHPKHFNTLLDLYIAFENTINNKTMDVLLKDPTIKRCQIRTIDSEINNNGE